MGKLNRFVVSFSNLQGVYYAGQVVEGQVTIELTDTMKMRGIHLKFKGKAKVEWEESETKRIGEEERTVTVTYSNSEKYFEHEILLAGRSKKQPGEDMKLHAGRHEYPFTFQLPSHLPSSFEGKYGHIRYTVKGTIDRPWKFDHKNKRAFTVIGLLDLNKEPIAATPAQESDSKQFCCLCCASGPLNATFRIDRHGYVPGEAIVIKAEIDNQSNKKMNSSSVVMNMQRQIENSIFDRPGWGVQYEWLNKSAKKTHVSKLFKDYMTFHAKTKSRTTDRRVAKLKHGEIQEGETHYWNGDQLVIPPLPPSFLVGCKIMDISYTLEFRVDPSGAGFDLVVPLDILIGTIPLQQVMEQYPTTPPPADQLRFTPNPDSYPPPGAAYPPGESLPQASALYPPDMPTNIPNLPPPSYGEDVFGKVNIKKDEFTYGDTNFAPVYTYYDWGHQPSAPPQ